MKSRRRARSNRPVGRRGTTSFVWVMSALIRKPILSPMHVAQWRPALHEWQCHSWRWMVTHSHPIIRDTTCGLGIGLSLKPSGVRR